MPEIKNHHRWAVILAGGDGLRLKSLTRFLEADDRPKQFCHFFGNRSLLGQTRNRIRPFISANDTLFVLVRSHELFYQRDLKYVRPSRMIEQPSNRGTLPAIVYSLLRTARLDPQAVVAFFPSDHHYTDEGNFVVGMESAFARAERNPRAIVLVAAPAKYAATDYGWIEVSPATPDQSGTALLSVKGFWEKPSFDMASDLLNRGCVWNTFVMVGTVAAFEDAIRAAAPEIGRAFDPLRKVHSAEEESRVAKEIYAALPLADFSKLVLSKIPERLAVSCLGDVGWTDLGNPERLVEALARTDVKQDWSDAWTEEMQKLSASA